MNTKMLKSVCVVLLTLSVLNTVYAAPAKGVHDAIALAYEQEELAQELAKTFFYIKQDILTQAAQTELDAALKTYKNNRLKMDSNPILKAYTDTFVLIDFIAEDYLAHVVKGAGASKAASAEILEMSEALTEAYFELAQAIEKKEGISTAAYENIVDRMPMQIERLAKYYVAYIAGFADKSTADALKKAVADFDKDLSYLIANPSSIAEVDTELKDVSHRWKTMKKYYEGVEKQQLPAVVLATTNKILHSLQKVALIYTQSLENAGR